MTEKRQTAIPLSELAPGGRAKVLELSAEGLVRRRLLDLGVVPQTIVEVILRSPIGDPTAYRIRGTTIGLRREDARRIMVEPL
ncbi:MULTISPECIES: FeoA family protein [Aneurinibacillus]|jgi:ferrous iron transport protein A|uniref:Iron transporter FeoA n=1 Tax=Aneurinibacillus danicus TaxID=267746 RepID=A0A511VCB2_9BACL|nr:MULTISPECIES: FeoA family protein [Aneurinibacillus]GEN36494.1 iron transporter FeoA [Aneurinibacillus danicus]